MIELCWEKNLSRQSFSLDKTSSRIPLSDKELFLFDVRSAQRSMTRSTLLVSYLLHQSRNIWQHDIVRKPHRIGLYCCFRYGPVAERTIGPLRENPIENWADLFRKNCPPKQHLLQNIGIQTAHLSWLIGSQGPCNTYFGAKDSQSQSLRQAELDLESHTIDKALVGYGCAAYGLESEFSAPDNIDEDVQESASLKILVRKSDEQ